MTITEQLEGLLPADGNYTTKDERVIAAAVKELRAHSVWQTNALHYWDKFNRERDLRIAANGHRIKLCTLAFATGCIASAIFVVLV